MTPDTFIEHFATFAAAPNGVAKLRELILQLAVQGQLVPQNENDERCFTRIREGNSQPDSIPLRASAPSRDTSAIIKAARREPCPPALCDALASQLQATESANTQLLSAAVSHLLTSTNTDEQDALCPRLRAAVALWNYCEASVTCNFGNSLANRTADAILAALNGAGEAGMSRTAISDLFNRNKSKSEIDNALQVLVDAKLARRDTIPTNGRSVETWFTTG